MFTYKIHKNNPPPNAPQTQQQIVVVLNIDTPSIVKKA